LVLAKIMAKMANHLVPLGHSGAVRRVSAADAKNQFGQILDTAIAGETVAITRYGEVKAIMMSVDEYDSLTRDPARKLNLLTEHFDAMLARMQTDEARRGMRIAFNASPQEMGRAAVKVARRKRAARALG
jgi:antitoxin Phd